MAFSRSNEFSLKTRLLFSAILAICATTFFSIACLAFFFLQWQDATFRSQQIESAKQALGLFAKQAAFPLAADDRMALESLFRTDALENPFLYLAIADERKTVRYHTDPDRVGSVMAFPVGPDDSLQPGPFHMRPRRLETEGEVLDLSIPVTYRYATLGYAHLGLSLDDLAKEGGPNGGIFFRKLLFWGMGPLAVSVISGILLALALSHMIGKSRDRQGTLFPETDGAGGGSPIPPDQPSSSLHTLQQRAGLCFPKEISSGKFVRNHVTVLSAGVRGFKSLADDKNAAEALLSLNAYFAIADEIIQEHGGFIDKFIGDAVIAVFGGSPLSPDHSERAVHCALALQEALRNAGEDANPVMGKVGIGISSGVVISARMGPRSREECAFLGESFKLAYSLNVMAGPREILVTKDVYRKIMGRVSVKPVPPREIMERTEPWEIFCFQSFTQNGSRD